MKQKNQQNQEKTFVNWYIVVDFLTFFLLQLVNRITKEVRNEQKWTHCWI
jgi:hypothetical protein